MWVDFRSTFGADGRSSFPRLSVDPQSNDINSLHTYNFAATAAQKGVRLQYFTWLASFVMRASSQLDQNRLLFDCYRHLPYFIMELGCFLFVPTIP